MNIDETIELINQVKIFISIEAVAGKKQILDDSKLVQFDQYFDIRRYREEYITQAKDWTAKQNKAIKYDSCKAVLSSAKQSIASSTMSLEKEVD